MQPYGYDGSYYCAGAGQHLTFSPYPLFYGRTDGSFAVARSHLDTTKNPNYGLNINKQINNLECVLTLQVANVVCCQYCVCAWGQPITNKARLRAST